MTKILLVEDNPLNQDMLSRRLARQGYEVALAVDGAASLSMAKTERPDLILMDMNIPIIDGWEATRQLKADVQTKPIPIIALTAHAMMGDREKALAAGCDDYATKPVEFKQLLATIRSFLPVNTPPAPPAVPQAPASTPTVSPVSAAPIATPPAAPAPATIPVAATPQTAPPETVEEETPATLLVVNDNPINREILSAHLQRKGYTVVTASDRDTALGILQSFSIDLLLLDLTTPATANLEALREIRQSHERATLAIIVVTASGRDEDVVKAFELGINDYVTKPINLSLILNRIQAQLKVLHSEESAELAPSVETAPEVPKATQPEPVRSNIATAEVTNFIPLIPAKGPVEAEEKKAQRPATILHSKDYPLGYVLAKTPLSQLKLAKNPTPENGHILCLMETFSVKDADETLRTEVRNAIQEERSQLEAIAQHKRIPNLLDFFENDHSFGWSQAYTEGHLLADELISEQRVSTARALKYVQEMLEALLPFHERQVVHASVQPSHLWRTQQGGDLNLISLGLSQRLSSYLAEHVSFEQRKLYAYEHDYMPIEQRIGQAVLSSDIYAVGLVASQLLTGKVPLVLTNILLSRRSPFESLPSVTPDIEKVLAKMLSQEHQERYQSASEALAAIKTVTG